MKVQTKYNVQQSVTSQLDVTTYSNSLRLRENLHARSFRAENLEAITQE